MSTNYQYMTKVANANVIQWLQDDSTVKQAADALNSFTRYKVREDGITRRILTHVPITNDQLDRDLDDKPVKYIDMEPDGPPAITVAFATLPQNVYIRGPRYRVLFGRVQTANFVKDLDELRTYEMDIRQVLSDNAIKDMLYEEDSTFFGTLATCMGGSADATSPYSGAVQWKTISRGITRDGVNEAFKIMPSGPTHLEPKLCVMNNVSLFEVHKWGRDEMGGDMSQDIVRDGWTFKNFMGRDWIFTIKRDLVPDDSMFMFPSEKFMGVAFVLDDTTMAIKREFFMINYFAYATLGRAIGNAATPCRADFGG